MKIKTKIAIFLIAVVLSLLEFNAIVSCYSCMDILKIGKKAGYEITANILPREANTVEYSSIKTLKSL